jgi:CelD/BcsL family acetyltransferase involved in cellulose biosynthesis
LATRLGERGWTSYADQLPASAILLPETWEAYLRQLSSKERTKVTYRRNRLSRKYRTRFYRCQSDRELPACLESLFALHRKRWQLVGQSGSFGSQARRKFYSELAFALARKDELEFWLLELDGLVAAAQFGFRRGDAVFSLQEGFDPAYFADSVGYVLRAHVVQQLIAQGVRRYDFLAGDTDSKTRWATHGAYYLNLLFARRFSLGSGHLRVTSGAIDSKEWLRGHLPRNAWLALRWLNKRSRLTKEIRGTVAVEVPPLARHELTPNQ